MNRPRDYFRRHPFVCWLTWAALSLAVFGGGEVLLGPPHWTFIVIMALGVPAAVLFVSGRHGEP